MRGFLPRPDLAVPDGGAVSQHRAGFHASRPRGRWGAGCCRWSGWSAGTWPACRNSRAVVVHHADHGRRTRGHHAVVLGQNVAGVGGGACHPCRCPRGRWVRSAARPDAACWSPSVHGGRHRSPGTGCRRSRQKPSYAGRRPCNRPDSASTRRMSSRRRAETRGRRSCRSRPAARWPGRRTYSSSTSAVIYSTSSVTTCGR